MKEISVIKNFLPKKEFKKIQNLILSDDFPWYYIKQSTYKKTKHQKDCFFSHSIKYKNEINSSFIKDIMDPIHKKLKYKNLLRAKLNLQVSRNTHIETNYHVDFPELVQQNKKYTTAIFYVNSCNGYTEFEINNFKCVNEENKLVIFPGELYHRGVSQTDENRRVLLNINFI